MGCSFDRMTPKLIKRYNNKGIFTIKQLSYLFKPRKRGKRSPKREQKFNVELQALAIRTGKIYIQDMNAIDNLDSAKNRQIYAKQAKVAVKIQDIYENILKTPEKWNEFARNIKYKNKNRPAFQQEFSKIISGWRDL